MPAAGTRGRHHLSAASLRRPAEARAAGGQKTGRPRRA